MAAGHISCNGQAQPDTFGILISRGIEAIECLERVLVQGFVHAGPVVIHRYFDTASTANRRLNHNPLTLVRCIHDEIGQGAP